MADQLVEDFDGVTVLQEVRAADLLTVEPSRTAPDSRTCATGAEVMMDRVRDVEHRRRLVQRDRMFAVPQIDAHQSRQLPDPLA